MDINKAISNLIAGRKDAGMIPTDEYRQTIDMAIAALKIVRRRKIPGILGPPKIYAKKCNQCGQNFESIWADVTACRNCRKRAAKEQ